MVQFKYGFGKVAVVTLLIVIAALATWSLFHLGLNGSEFGNQTVTIASLEKPQWSPAPEIEANVSEGDLQAAYQEYLDAYNKLSEIIAEGRGDSPEAEAQLGEYERLKQRFYALKGE